MFNSESRIQESLMNWFAWTFPNALFTISISGVNLNRILGARLKRMGYRAGTPDIMIFEPRGGFNGLFIELKTEKGRTTREQDIFISALDRRGYHAVVCYGREDAEATILNYMKMPENKNVWIK